MKKILLIDPADFLGGAELFCTEIANELANKGYNIHLATNGIPSYTKKINSNVKIHKIKMKRIKSVNPLSFIRLFYSFFKLQKLVKKEKFDIIQSNSIRSHILASIVSISTKIPCIWYVHDFTFGKKFASVLSPSPKYILHNSDAVKKDLENKIPQKFWYKFKKVPNGFDISAINKNAQSKIDLHKKYNIPKHYKLIGLIGRIDWWKGQKEFIQAAKLILEKNSHYAFLIVGEANKHDKKTLNYENEIRHLVKDMQIEKNLIFTGHVNNIYSYIKNLDVLVHASIEAEPFGRVIIEGMSLKTPVIASNLGGPAEIINDKKDGLLWNAPSYKDLAEKINILSNDTILKNNIINNAYSKVNKKYTLGHVVSALTDLYYGLRS